MTAPTRPVSPTPRPSAVKSGLFVLAAVLVPNLALLISGQYFFIQRAWVNVDYVLVAILGLVLRRRPGWLALLVGMVFITDIMFAFAPAYHFTLGSLIQSAQGLRDLGFGFVALNAGILLVAAAFVALGFVAAMRRISHHGPALGVALLFGTTIFVLDSLVSTSALRLGETVVRMPNLGFSTSLNAITAFRTSTRPEASAPNAMNVNAATDDIRTLIDNGTRPPQLIILINVESLGLFRSSALNDYQLAPLAQLDDDPDWQITVGEVPFEGSTVAAELRELCDVRYLTVRPILDRGLAPSCLVQQLEGLGYHTTAFHGFQGTLFERNRWYRELGFDQIYFGGKMMKEFDNLERCGSAFEGICDRSAWQAVIQTAKQASRPAFIYWMTLTAHLPVLPNKDLGHRHSCRSLPDLDHASAVCDHMQWHRSLFREIVQDLQQSRFDDTRLILVGDHPPSFLDQQRRALFSETHVPFVEIRATEQISMKTGHRAPVKPQTGTLPSP